MHLQDLLVYYKMYQKLMQHIIQLMHKKKKINYLIYYGIKMLVLEILVINIQKLENLKLFSLVLHKKNKDYNKI